MIPFNKVHANLPALKLRDIQCPLKEHPNLATFAKGAFNPSFLFSIALYLNFLPNELLNI
jgi:hypothetical protein